MSEPSQSQRSSADGNTHARIARVPAAGNGSAHNGNGASARVADGHPIDVLELFTDLAAACVPAFCDGLQFDLVADGVGDVSAAYPTSTGGAASANGGEHSANGGEQSANGAEHPAIGGAASANGGAAPHNDRADGALHGELSTGAGRIVIAVRTEQMATQPPVAGTITCTWHDQDRPTKADALVVRLLADQAVARLRLETLGTALQKQLIRAANLEEALSTNREIGQAIGILMATDHVTAGQAFEKLRTASQHTHRKLREIAADVTETGVLAVAPELVRPQVRRPADGRADERNESSSRVQRRTRGGQPVAAASDEA